MTVFFKLSGYALIGFGLALLSHILLVTIQLAASIWSSLAAVAAVMWLVAGLTMLVAVPFAGLRQIGAAFLVLGLAVGMIGGGDVLLPLTLVKMLMVVLALVGGYLLVLMGIESRNDSG